MTCEPVKDAPLLLTMKGQESPQPRRAAVGLAAEAGATHVVAAVRPRVAILSTGSELVPVRDVPAHGRTRNSNEPMIAAAVAACGGEPIMLGIAADRPEAIRSAVMQALAADVVVLSGGVSAGDLDLVPATFTACGVEKIFHKVRLKPGKPVWFGRLDRAAGPAGLVFGLPGNPASSLVCFELFVRPALAILAVTASAQPRGEVSLLGEGDDKTMHYWEVTRQKWAAQPKWLPSAAGSPPLPIAKAVELKLAAMEPHREAARKAVALQAMPFYCTHALQSLYHTVDAMWHAIGDTSTDFNFYTTRLTLAGVFSATLIFWLDDTSPGHALTLEFLDRRIGDVMRLEKLKARVRQGLRR
jgi:rpsU-divergently transcribed protein